MTNYNSFSIKSGKSNSLIGSDRFISLYDETLSLVGPAFKGPAFVPTQVTSFGRQQFQGSTLNTLENVFGEEKNNYSKSFNLANAWLNGSASQLSYTRILGIGNNEDPDQATGIVPESGFIVGEKNVRNSFENNKANNNKYAQNMFDNSDVNIDPSLSLKDGDVFFYCEEFIDEEGEESFSTINSCKNIIKQLGKDINKNTIVYEKTININFNGQRLLDKIENNKIITITDTDGNFIKIKVDKDDPTPASEFTYQEDSGEHVYTLYINNEDVLFVDQDNNNYVNNIAYYINNICEHAKTNDRLNSSFNSRSEYNKFIIGSNYYNKNWLENDSITHTDLIFSDQTNAPFSVETKASYNFSSYMNTKVFMTPQGVYLSLNPTQNNTSTVSSSLSKNSVLNSNNIVTEEFKNYDLESFTYNINNNTLNSNLKSKAVLNDSSINNGTSSRKLLGSPISVFTNKIDIHTWDLSNRIYINGLKYSTHPNNVITFSPENKNDLFIKNTLTSSTDNSINRDFFRLYEKGHVEYASFDSNNYLHRNQDIFGCFKQILDTASSTETTIPEYKNFQSIFTTAKTPWVVSQIRIKSKEDNLFSNNSNLAISDVSSNLTLNRENIESQCESLFKFHSIDDGESGNRFRIRITPKRLGKYLNVRRDRNTNSNFFIQNEATYDHIWSTFDINIFEYDMKTNKFTNVLSFTDVNLNKDDKNYICRLFGTRKTFWDRNSNKIVTTGEYRQTNNYLIVEVTEDVENKNISPLTMPSGFRSYPNVTLSLKNLDVKNKIESNGSIDLSKETSLSVIKTYIDSDNSTELGNFNTSYKIKLHNSFVYDNFGNDLNLVQKPLEYKSNLNINKDFDIQDIYEDYWGVSFTRSIKKYKNRNSVLIKNSDGGTFFKSPISSYEFIRYENESDTKDNRYRPYHEYAKFFQNSRNDNKNTWNELENSINPMFHLEKILYHHLSPNAKDKWKYSFYRKDGASLQEIVEEYSFYEVLYKGSNSDEDIANKSQKSTFSDGYYRYVNIDELLDVEGNSEKSDHSEYLKFDFFTYGGFDGTNKFDNDKDNFTNISVIRELENEDSNASTKGPSYTSYDVAIDIATKESNNVIDLFCVPGITHPTILRKITNIVEDKRNLFAIIDIPVLNNNSEYVSDICFEQSFENPDDVLNLFEDFNVSTENSLNFFNSLNIKSRFVYPVYNNIISVDDRFEDDLLKRNIYLPGSYLAIKNLSKTFNSINQNISNTSNLPSISYKIIDLLDKNIVQENNKKSLLIRKAEKYNINVICKENNVDNSFRFNSSLSSFDNKSNPYRLMHNTRTILQIKKDLKFTLYGAVPDKFNFRYGGILFSQNLSRTYLDSNRQIEDIIDTVMSFYLDNNLIKNYFIKFDKLNTISNASQDLVSGQIYIDFFGLKDSKDFAKIDLDNLAGDVDNIVSNNNLDIVNIR